MTAGVYLISSNQDDRVYVGSAQNLERRIDLHRKALRNGRHHSTRLQAAWDKMGESAFSFETLLVVDNLDHLVLYEQFWIDRLNASHFAWGFNKQRKAVNARGYTLYRERRPRTEASSQAGIEELLARGPFRIEGLKLIDRMGIVICTTISINVAKEIGRVLHWNNQWKDYPI